MESLFRPAEFWNKISFTLLHKPDNCSRRKFTIFLVQQSLMPWMAGLSLVTQIQTDKLEIRDTLEWVDSFMFDRRDIFLKEAVHGTCTILIKLDPYVKLDTSLPPFLSILDKDTHDFDLQSMKMTLLVMGRFTKTWGEAEAMCNTLGGHLPSITSEDDRKTLQAIMMRDQLQHNTSLKYPNNCRVFDPLCVIFIGIQGKKVRHTAN